VAEALVRITRFREQPQSATSHIGSPRALVKEGNAARPRAAITRLEGAPAHAPEQRVPATHQGRLFKIEGDK
jgi:hypothetical protein